MKLTINRSRWLRGDTNSSLLRGVDNKMCCLGFLACSLGATEDEIKNHASPATTTSVKWLDGMTKNCEDCTTIGNVHIENTSHTDNLIHINDDLSMSDNDREEKLTKEFAAIGIEVEFVD